MYVATFIILTEQLIRVHMQLASLVRHWRWESYLVGLFEREYSKNEICQIVSLDWMVKILNLGGESLMFIKRKGGT